MATNRRIIEAANELSRAQDQLQALKDRKATLQAGITEVNLRIDEVQPVVNAALAALKTLVNEP
jgi:prefoldin subunit 5